MSGLNSIPIAWAPRFAAAITVRPSPEPKVNQKICRSDFGNIEHGVNQFHWCWYPNHIFALLAYLWFKFRISLVILCIQAGCC